MFALTKKYFGRCASNRVSSASCTALLSLLSATTLSWAQNPPAAAEGLPPASTVVGPLLRGPDGTIEVRPKAENPESLPTRPHKAAPAHPLSTAMPEPKSGPADPQTNERQPPPAPTVTGAAPAPADDHGVSPATATEAERPRTIPTQAQRAPFGVGVPPSVTSQIHNASGWLPSHDYAPATPPTRVNNGAGWDSSAQTFLSYSPLAAYQLTSGPCTSAAVGGPSGTGSSITDGTCTWKYLSKTDYVTITGWMNDNAKWVPGSYNYNDIRVSGTPLSAYKQTKIGCSSTIPPTDSGGGTADGCTWAKLAYITYTSGVSHIPTETYAPRVDSAATVNITRPYKAEIWNDREYLAGANGEAEPILMSNHNYRYNDSLGQLYLPPDSPGYNPAGDSLNGYGWPITLTAAPGESFRDTLLASPSTPVSGYDQRLGVGIHDTSNNSALTFWDNAIVLQGLQVKADRNTAVEGLSERACNYCSIDYSIIEGGPGGTGTVRWGAAAWFTNDLFISHNYLGTMMDYTGQVLHSTIVNPEGTGTVAFEVYWDWKFGPQVIADTVMIGFAHAVATPNSAKPQICPGDQHIAGGLCLTWAGSNNVTDAPVGDNGTGVPGWPESNKNATVYIMPGTTYGSSGSAVFQSYPGNYRPKADGPLVGTGTAYGPFSPCDVTSNPCPPIYTGLTYADSPDLIGRPRPPYDIGAIQSVKPSSQ